jgi:small GTP-binding protein
MVSHAAVKAVLVGDTDVGKTAIFKRLEDNTFDKRQIPTVGGSYLSLSLTGPDGSQTNIGLWDTAGHERFRTIVPMYFQRAVAIICVFDLAQRASFDHIRTWVEMARTTAPDDVKFLLIGNKSDLDEDRQVELPVATELSDSIGAKAYIETSALSGAGIDLLKGQLAALASRVNQEQAVVEQIDPEVPIVEGRLRIPECQGGKC